MLRHLRIENYALIESLEIEFEPGLNLLTGETGSGKSIVVDALGLLLGDRSSPETVRSGADRARVMGIFSPDSPASKPTKAARTPRGSGNSSKPPGERAEVAALLEEAGIEAGDGREVIVQREVQAAGRSRIFINNQPATLALLKTLAPHLCEVHGQNEQQQLFEPRTQLEFLDRHGKLLNQVAQVEKLFGSWKSLRQQAEALAQENREWLRQRDLWLFQKQEIEQAAIVEGEDQRLEEEKTVLAHAERIQARLSSCYEQLYDSPTSAVASIGSAQRQLEEVSQFDAALQPLVDGLASARATVEDLALTVRDRLSGFEANPARLEEIENRLELLDRLKRKYGATLADVLHYWEDVSLKVNRGSSGEEELQKLEEGVRTAANEYQTAAKELSAARAKAAKELKRAVERELQTLAMAGTKFEASLHSAADAEQDWRATGVDTVEFVISPNPGEPLRPLARIASGGETSRIMLALETVVASQSRASQTSSHTLVFDEVDSGIGGSAAESVGQKLRDLAGHYQVLCVTHLAQIASFAQAHFRVEKVKRGTRTFTQVRPLDGAERRAELARMLSGSRITPSVLEHAEQLLRSRRD